MPDKQTKETALINDFGLTTTKELSGFYPEIKIQTARYREEKLAAWRQVEIAQKRVSEAEALYRVAGERLAAAISCQNSFLAECERRGVRLEEANVNG